MTSRAVVANHPQRVGRDCPGNAQSGLVATIAEATPNLSEDQVSELLELLKGTDTVELKLTVPSTDRAHNSQALGIDPLTAQIRQVYFFDTPDLTLNKAGLVVRARRVQGREHDSVVKLRPVVPDDLSPKLRRRESFGVEVDAMPGGFVCSASMKGLLGTVDVHQSVKGERPLRKLFSKEQRAFYAEHAPEGLALDDLSILGPIFVLKAKFNPPELKRKIVAEVWMYPDNSTIVELSTKCAPADTFKVATEGRKYLESQGVDLSGEQETKTKKAVEFFAARLNEAS